jgi:RNA polymerase sigma-70 factor (ECF subfamily)
METEAERREAFLNDLSGCESTLRGLIAGALSRVDDRADAFQEVVLVLWRTYSRYDRSRPFLPWAMGVAMRRLKEEYRSIRKRPGLLPDAELDELASALVATAAEPRQEAEALAGCLRRLPERSAQLVRRRYFEETSIGQLAAETGQTAASVYQQLSRLRRQLALCIRQRMSIPIRPVNSHEYRS